MRFLLWACRISIFGLVLAFALKNTDLVIVRFLMDSEWQAPLIVVLLSFFAGGVILGILSLLGTVFRLRREIASLKRARNPSATSVGNGP